MEGDVTADLPTDEICCWAAQWDVNSVFSCSALWEGQWKLRNSGGTQAMPGTPILSEVHTSGRCCPDLEAQGESRSGKHTLLACRKAGQMSEGLAIMLLTPEVSVSAHRLVFQPGMWSVSSWFSALHTHTGFTWDCESFILEHPSEEQTLCLHDVCHTCQESQTTSVLGRNWERKIK